MRLIAFFLTFIALCAILIAGARWIGQTQAPRSLYLEPGDCQQPCWQGLRPGAVQEDHLIAQAQAVSIYTIGYTRQHADGLVTIFRLDTQDSLQLADVLRELGPPDRVGCLTVYPNVAMRGAVTGGELYFADGLVVVGVARPGADQGMSPEMNVRYISYYAPGEPAYPIGKTTTWSGFASARYLRCYWETQARSFPE